MKKIILTLIALVACGMVANAATKYQINVGGVEVTSDNSYATVYFSPIGVGSDEEVTAQQQEVLEAFEKAKGHIRSEVGKKMKLRHVPELIFKVDHSMEYGRHIEDIISKL